MSNPTPEPSPGQEFPSDNPNDLHKPSLDRPPGSDTRPRGYSQPTVEEVPDDHDNIQHRLAQRSSLDESLHPSRASSVPPPTFQPSPTAAERPANKHTNGEDYYKTAATGDDVSPIDSAYTDRQASEGGGYFPRVPTFASDLDEPEQPAAPPEDLSFSPTRTMPDSLAFPPTSPTTPRTGQQPMDTFRPFPTPSVHHSGVYNQPQSDQPTSQPQQPSFTSEPPNPEIHGGYGRNYSSVQPTVLHSPPPTQVTESGTAVVDEEAILKAQKHARWAISALNFEDVNTAIKELRGALESLGAF